MKEMAPLGPGIGLLPIRCTIDMAYSHNIVCLFDFNFTKVNIATETYISNLTAYSPFVEMCDVIACCNAIAILDYYLLLVEFI